MARGLGVGGTDDAHRFLIAWVWFNPAGADQAWSLRNAAVNYMDHHISMADARETVDHALDMRARRKADELAHWLGITPEMRERFHLRTIGAIGSSKRLRTMQRKRKAKARAAERRKAAGATPHAKSLARTKPWEALGMSRSTWYRMGRPETRETISCALVLAYPSARNSLTNQKEALRATRPPNRARPRGPRVRPRNEPQKLGKIARAAVVGIVPRAVLGDEGKDGA